MRLRLAGFAAITIAVSTFLCTFSACSNSEPLPDAGGFNNASSSSGGGSSSGKPAEGGGPVDSGFDANDGAVPDSCKNTIKDNLETDVDCGGTQCAKCIDTKKCIMPSDCAGGSCVSNVCVTASCMDMITNGLETDKDCGGTTCAKCQFGKHCNKNEDCQSNNCNGNICRCPPLMAEVGRATGGTYCVDATEVTKSAYDKFIKSGWKIADQGPECANNMNFLPRSAWPPGAAPPIPPIVGAGTTQGYQFNISLPVHYVDWCDAYTYCKWNNKELCGRINGGAITQGTANADSNEDAWYNACSGGSNVYPYGQAGDFTAQHVKCNGSIPPDAGKDTVCGPTPQGNTYGCETNGDENVWAVIIATDDNGSFAQYQNGQCLGTATGLYQMSGNVAEWENSCDSPTSTTAKCNLRGGSSLSNDDPTALRCDAVRTEDRVPSDSTKLKDVGFRCCLY